MTARAPDVQRAPTRATPTREPNRRPRSLRETLKGWRAKPEPVPTPCSFLDCTVAGAAVLGTHVVCDSHYQVALRRLTELLRGPDAAAAVPTPALAD